MNKDLDTLNLEGESISLIDIPRCKLSSIIVSSTLNVFYIKSTTAGTVSCFVFASVHLRLLTQSSLVVPHFLSLLQSV